MADETSNYNEDDTGDCNDKQSTKPVDTSKISLDIPKCVFPLSEGRALWLVKLTDSVDEYMEVVYDYVKQNYIVKTASEELVSLWLFFVSIYSLPTSDKTRGKYKKS